MSDLVVWLDDVMDEVNISDHQLRSRICRRAFHPKGLIIPLLDLEKQEKAK